MASLPAGTQPSRWDLSWLDRDGRRLFATRVLRAVAYGYMAVVLALYLQQIGLNGFQTGLVLTVALAGSAAMNVFWSVQADRFGRRRTLVTMSALMVAAGLLFAASTNLWLLLLVACSGTISTTPSGSGVFTTLEQAILPQTAPDERRTWTFSLYELLGSFGGAVGALFAGTVAFWGSLGLTGAAAYRPLFVLYALVGASNLVLAAQLSDRVELAPVAGPRPRFGVHRSRGMVARLSLLFGLDSFAGALVVQPLVAYWFHVRWGFSPGELAVVFFWVNAVAGLSFLGVAPLARRIGLLNTMVFTHLPSNVLLALVPLAPTPALAVVCFLLRMSMSQMDVPTRKSYMMAVVDPDERTATAGITNTARTVASAVAPAVSGAAFSVAALGVPFYAAGALKVLYDSLMYVTFRNVRPPEEQERLRARSRVAVTDRAESRE